MKYLILRISFTLVACTDPVEQCVQRKQDSWRKSNPTADYAKSSTANERFRKECGGQKK